MKKGLLTILLCAAILTGCSSRQSVREDTIRNNVLQNAPGDKDAYTFKILELSELRTITVLDSINHIKAGFNIEHHKELEYQEKLLQFITRLETATANNRFVSENEKAEAVRKIETNKKWSIPCTR